MVHSIFPSASQPHAEEEAAAAAVTEVRPRRKNERDWCFIAAVLEPKPNPSFPPCLFPAQENAKARNEPVDSRGLFVKDSNSGRRSQVELGAQQSVLPTTWSAAMDHD